MISYEDGLATYTRSRVNKVVAQNKKMIAQIRALNGMFTRDSIVQDLTIYIAQAVERCIGEINTYPTSTFALISNLRFIFETCITARLLNLEPSYKFKVRFSIYKHQLEKSKSLASQAAADMSRLDKLKQDETEVNRLHCPVDDHFVNRGKVNELYEKLNSEISIFLDASESFGIEMTQNYIERYLKDHSAREKKIEDEWNSIKKEIIQDPEAISHFNFKGQTSKVDKELSDTRSWKQKAVATGLGPMHEFLYDYTSSIMHSTSYSIMVPYPLEPGELFMIEGLAARFSHSILTELCTFGKIPMNMTVIDVGEG
ncbi:hypothetical protein [Pseudomonas laurylsulfatiphila]|jgi:hypothetical protein|uniref:hypothetical protein n=1 Tax=Pseudomonas laurylsulfatiphila TaxID=2011015 RepID=UPI003D25D812